MSEPSKWTVLIVVQIVVTLCAALESRQHHFQKISGSFKEPVSTVCRGITVPECGVSCVSSLNCTAFSVVGRGIWTDDGPSTDLHSNTDRDTEKILDRNHISNKGPCHAVPNLEHGKWRVGNRKVSQKAAANPLCDEDYMFVGERKRIVCDNGTWEETDGGCHRSAFRDLSLTCSRTSRLDVRFLTPLIVIDQEIPIAATFLKGLIEPRIRLTMQLLADCMAARFIDMIWTKRSVLYSYMGIKTTKELGQFALKSGEKFTLVLSSEGNKIKFKLSNGFEAWVKQRNSERDFQAEVNQLVLMNDNIVQEVVCYRDA